MMKSILRVGYYVAILTRSSIPAFGGADFGTVVSHNGNLGLGTGNVQVDFSYPEIFGPHYAEYFEVATHQVQYAYLSPSNPFMVARAFLINTTGVAWQGFQIRLEGADFSGRNGGVSVPVQAASLEPVVDIGIGPDGAGQLPNDKIGIEHTNSISSNFSLLSSSITRFNDQGSGFRDAELTVLFDNPLPVDNKFRLHYNVFASPGAAGATGFNIFLTPIPIPEPATMVLLCIGSIELVRRHRVR